MTVVAIVLLVLAAIGVFAIAAAVIGREAHRLDAVAPRAVYILDEAVDFVADHLPPESQARLTHDEVRQLLAMHMGWLREKGLQPPIAVDHVQDIAEPVVVEETTAVGYLIGRAEAAGLEVDDVDVVNVVEAHLAYLDAIGAVGPPAEDPDVPLP
jgi:hypothetical protein